MPPDVQSTAQVAASLAAVQARIASAAKTAGRLATDISLIAVSKTHPAGCVLAALQAGQMCFGENRVQEAAEKFPALRAAWPALRLHLIGTLQTNKAEQAVRLADMIESLDRPRLADALERAAEKAGRLPELLVQINIGDEAQKSGVPAAEADAFIAQCKTRFGAKLRGLMCIPPAAGDPAPHFQNLAGMARRHDLPVLSMGMSGDYEAAIRCGATQVRVGSAIFGAR